MPRGIALISLYLMISGLLSEILLILSVFSKGSALFLSFLSRIDLLNLSPFLAFQGAILVLAGIGLYQMRIWAYWASILNSILNIAFSLYTMINLYPFLLSENPAYALLPLGADILIILYLYEKRKMFNLSNFSIQKIIMIILILLIPRAMFVPQSLMTASYIENLVNVKGTVLDENKIGINGYVYFYPEIEEDGIRFSSEAFAMSRIENGTFSAGVPEGHYRVRILSPGYTVKDVTADVRNGTELSILLTRFSSTKLDFLGEYDGRRIEKLNSCIIAEFGYLGLPGKVKALYLREASKYINMIIYTTGNSDYLRKLDGSKWTVLKWADIYNKELNCPCAERLIFVDEAGNATQLICCMEPNFLFKMINWMERRRVPEIYSVEMKFRGGMLEIKALIHSYTRGNVTFVVEKFSYDNITPSIVLKRNITLEEGGKWVDVELDKKEIMINGLPLSNLRISIVVDGEIADMELFSIPVRFGKYP